MEWKVGWIIFINNQGLTQLADLIDLDFILDFYWFEATYIFFSEVYKKKHLIMEGSISILHPTACGFGKVIAYGLNTSNLLLENYIAKGWHTHWFFHEERQIDVRGRFFFFFDVSFSKTYIDLSNNVFLFI